ncbi:MAG: helix-turn-helix domain-containing protein [Candidatus Avilachnospira sp.]
MAKGKYEYWLSPEGLLKLEGWARDGLTDEQIAAKAGIRASTLYDWKNKHSEISEALKRGKEVVDIMVENALLKRALGYSYTEDKYITVPMNQAEYADALDKHMKAYKFDHPDATDTELREEIRNFPRVKKVLSESKTKEVIPDTTAQIFWLKNRRPDKWRDMQKVELSGEVSNPYAGLTTEELRQLIKNG